MIGLLMATTSANAADIDHDHAETQLLAQVGAAVFDKLWVFSPSSTRASDGLGPLYNARSCRGCHHNATLARPSETGQWMEVPNEWVLRLSHNAPIADGKIRPDPIYGFQIQPHAYPGAPPEALVEMRAVPSHTLSLHQEASVTLIQWNLRLSEWASSPLHDDTRISLRRTPSIDNAMVLAHIPEAALLELADPDDRDGDGISGRVNHLATEASREPMIGRFGWKASIATLEEQSLRALSLDIGISSWLHPDPAGDCTSAQPDCRSQPHGDGPESESLEAPKAVTDALMTYLQSLPLPLQPEPSPGQVVFEETGCAACHLPSLLIDNPNNPGRHRTLWPYSDGLLHDMGDMLADGFSEGEATQREWRTAPLRDIAKRARAEQTGFLHDARAATLMEAILWHDGEALASRERFRQLGRTQRHALMAFLESL